MTIEELDEKLNAAQEAMSGAEIYDMGRTEVAEMLESFGCEVHMLPKKTYVHLDGTDYVVSSSWLDDYTPRIVLVDECARG